MLKRLAHRMVRNHCCYSSRYLCSLFSPHLVSPPPHIGVALGETNEAFYRNIYTGQQLPMQQRPLRPHRPAPVPDFNQTQNRVMNHINLAGTDPRFASASSSIPQPTLFVFYFYFIFHVFHRMILSIFVKLSFLNAAIDHLMNRMKMVGSVICAHSKISIRNERVKLVRCHFYQPVIKWVIIVEYMHQCQYQYHHR